MALVITRRGRQGFLALSTLISPQSHYLIPQHYLARSTLSPSTGVLDVYEFVRALERDIINLGGEIIYNSQVTGAASATGEFVLTHDSESSFRLKPRLIINAYGHHAHSLARQLMGESAPLPP